AVIGMASVILCVDVLGMGHADPPATPPQPTGPVQGTDGSRPPVRALTGDDAKRVAELENTIGALRQAGKFAEALPAARTVLEIHRRVQGEAYWETKDALYRLRTLEQISTLPAEAQAELLMVIRSEGEMFKFHDQRRHAEGIPLLQRALAVYRGHLGEEHVDVAAAMKNWA